MPAGPRARRQRPPRPSEAVALRIFRSFASYLSSVGGLGLVAMAYIGVDYLRYIAPLWHARLLPALWVSLALAAVARAPFYGHWQKELRAAVPFLAALVFMLAAFLCEALSVRFVTALLGLQWHRSTNPLPDTGQWLLLSLNEVLPQTMVDLLRAHIITLHHFLMLFMMLGFSVLFGSIKAPGLGIAARYMFTMAIGRLLRTVTFIATILPSARPWCADARYKVPWHPHPWPQKYYMPYASDSAAIYRLITEDMPYAEVEEYPDEYRPDWGVMSFLADILRPSPGEASTWYQLLKKASGGCNDLMYSGHMLVAVLTAMAWTEAYGGWTSVLIWVLVAHSAQREIRERHHYSVDCIVAIYVGILLWKMTRFLWSAEDTSRARRVAKLGELEARIVHAAKDSDIDEVRNLLKEVEVAGREQRPFSRRAILIFATAAISFSLTCVLLALTLTSDG